MDTITLTFTSGEKREYRKGIKLIEIINDVKKDYKHDIILGRFKNGVINYEDSINKNGNLYFYDINTPKGNLVYEKGLTLLFKSSAFDILGKDIKIKIRHSLDKGIFCEIPGITDELVLSKIKDKMREKIEKGIPFIKIETSRLDAIDFYKKNKRETDAKTLFYNPNQFITLYKFDGMYEYIMGDMPHDASILKYFDLTLMENKGIVLRFPSVYDDGKVLKYKHHEKYFNSIEEYSVWSNLFNIDTIGDLNEYISTHGPSELIHLSEIVQDYKLLNIAEEITLNKDDIKMILISGPSSSGKTTTSKKLALYLKTLGLNPIQLSIDDYFVNREETPLDENGEPDYEGLRAIDLDLFNNHIDKLLKGVRVNTPVYDFIEGRKVFSKVIQMEKNDVLIIEGLHALNSELTKSVPKKNKYKIYISPLAWLNIDNTNRISITDIRLIRRIIRDNRTRGYNPGITLNNWRKVRIGEEKYVFPYQDEADVIFNTFLAYELGVLKTYVEPLLYTIKEDDPEYLTALKLIEIFKFVLPIPSEDVSKLSILREFIGGSYFE